MKLNEFSLDRQLDELIPPSMGGAQPSMGGAQPASNMAQPGADQQSTVTQDPAARALAVKQMADQKREIQNTIRQKQKEIQELQKQLAQIR